MMKMIKFVKCPHCGNQQKMEIDATLAKFDHKETEILQKECFKIFKRIEKLQYKHDFEDLPNWMLNYINNQISALKKIEDILSAHL